MFESAEAVREAYERGKEHHRRLNLYSQTRQNYDFYEGRQWEGLISKVTPPVYNIIKHIVAFKFNTMAMQDIQTVFSSDEEEYQEYANALNDYAKNLWQRAKLHDNLRQLAKGGCIAGDDYMYFADESEVQLIDNVDIHFADEQLSEVQKQKYILIVERLFVEDVKKVAEFNNLDKGLISTIVSDEELEEGKNIIEVEGNKKCTCFLVMWKEGGTVHSLRATQNVIYSPEKDSGLKLYPIVGLTVNPRKGSRRGIGEVQPLIANQININKTIYRRTEAVKDVCFPKVVYNGQVITNPEILDAVGSKIKVSSGSMELRNILQYIQPSYIGSAAKELNDELILMSKELNGSGDGATGQINPEKASGEAIRATTQQASIAASETSAAYRQAVEDIGAIIIELWRVYHYTDVGGLEFEGQLIPLEAFDALKFDINISPATPYDKLAVEQSLKELFISGHISFEEFVDALDENGNMPKAQLQAIIDKRDKIEENQYKLIIEELQKRLAYYEAQSVTASP